MDVKDVNGAKAGSVGQSLSPVRVLTVSTLPGLTEVQPSEADSSIESSDSVTVAEENSRPTVSQQKLRSRINTAIEATNVATGAVDEIGRILGGIEGIIEQVSSEDLPPQRVAILEKEARGLREEIVKAANSATTTGTKPLAGDKIRLELEETLGKTLEIILPDKATVALGLKEIGLSPKDVIINTVARVQEARRSLEDLRTQLDSGVVSIRTAVSALEVASQNVEASQTTVRDVDDALDLARDTKGGIQGNPSGAIGSVGDLAKNASELLKS